MPVNVNYKWLDDLLTFEIMESDLAELKLLGTEVKQ